MSIRRALLSVFDKNGIIEFARGLSDLGIELISSGGTAKLLGDAGLKVTLVSELTGFSEMLDGRVKTLHPKVHGAILARREDQTHMATLDKLDILPIDMVVCNLYPFEAAVSKGVDMAEAMENMDIGGPSLIRSAAKNHKDVLVIVSPSQYTPVLDMLQQDKDISLDTRGVFAREAMLQTAAYDIAIHEHLRKNYKDQERFPRILLHRYEKVQDCRYGENKHQEGSFYSIYGMESGLLKAKKLHGKELSFNNFLDLSDAMRIVSEFEDPTVAVLKHSNPCGVASRDSVSEAFELAFEADAKSAFGSVIGFNRSVDLVTAKATKGRFIEAIIAPDFDDDALARLKRKKNIRLVTIDPGAIDRSEPDMKRILGGMLFQTFDSRIVNADDFEIVTKKRPTPEQLEDLVFAWKVVRNVKSNAIVLVKDKTTVGVGAGQMSRVDSTEIAVKKSAGKCVGSVLASDAFFPFRDAIDAAGENGIVCIAQPGGSIRDEEVIQAADEHELAMVFTGVRCFRH